MENSPTDRRTGIALMLTSSASNQTGAALGARAFDAIGPVGVVAVRQFITAAILVPLVRPRFRLRRDQWWPVIGLVVVFSAMNLSLYAAVERIGLGLAVTLEFLGPLTVAVAGSRRAVDGCGAVVAALGVLLLTRPGGSADAAGIAFGLLAATAWGAYILLNRTCGQRLPGLQGTAVASVCTATVWIPVAAVWFLNHPPTATVLGLAAACGVLSSVIPYVADISALRRIPATTFGTFTSVNPVWAALAGWLFLSQALGGVEWAGIALIAVSNVIISVHPRQRHRRRGHRAVTSHTSSDRVLQA
jgi:inner membrane transporter RhtA